QRVEADDRGATARQQEVGDEGKGGVELIELVIDRDPQSLEDACGWVDRPVPAAAWHASTHQFGQFAGSANRVPAAGFHDPASNSPAESFLPKVKEQVCQLVGRESVDQISGGWAEFTRVKPHVKRPVGREAEPAVLPGELVRRKSKVQKDPIDP